ncbi:MAG: hypothetical protein ACKPKO_06890, partial [Candidatus Fonsibacter sp.]
MIIITLPLWCPQRVSAVDCNTYGILEGLMPSLNISPTKRKLIHHLAGQWDAGGRAPQEVQPQEIEPGYVCPSIGELYLALIAVEWLLDATLRVLRDWQEIVLGDVIVGCAGHDDIDVFLNCGQVLVVGTFNGNGTLDRPIVTLGGDGLGMDGIPPRCRICGPAGCRSLRQALEVGLFQLGFPLKVQSRQ